MEKQELKDKWVEALRSGEYKQCQGTLKRDTENGIGFCCLGVYLEAVLGVDLETEDSDSEYEGSWVHYKRVKEDIPIGVVDNGISMNDEGMPFGNIADMIEEEWVIKNA